MVFLFLPSFRLDYAGAYKGSEEIPWKYIIRMPYIVFNAKMTMGVGRNRRPATEQCGIREDSGECPRV